MIGTALSTDMRTKRGPAWLVTAVVLLYVWGGLLCFTTAQTAMRVGSFSAINLLRDKVTLRNMEGTPDPMRECSVNQTIQMEWDVLLVSRTSTDAAYALSLDTVACRSSECPLLAVDGWTLSVARGTGSVMLSPAAGQSARYPVGQSAVRLILIVAAGGKARLCVGTRCSVPSQMQGATLAPDGWVSAAGPDGTGGRVSDTLQLGFRGLTAPDAVVAALWVLGSPASGPSVTTLDPPTVWAALGPSGVSQQPLSSPSISPITQQPGGLVVGQGTTFSTSTTVGSGAAACQLRLTVYGVPPTDCKAAGCGNLVAQTAVYTSSCSVSVAATYPRAGRYLVRAEASDAAGGWSSRDLEVIVRKVGDNGAAAPCCRQTALIVTSQLGRPIHTQQFRPKSLEAAAVAAGWAPSYLHGPEDLEAERLFDYGMLAPFESRPVRNVSCTDVYLAGQGSPTVFGITAAGLGFTSNHGHNKRVVIVPQGFNWTSSPPAGMSLPACTTHWSDWPSRSPHQSQVITSSNARAACSYTCTVDGLNQMVEQTGSYDRWREAVIESTYGRLSLAPDPVVVPTLYMPPTTDGRNAFSYSEGPVAGHLQQLGYDMGRDFHTVLVLSPSPRFVNPGYSAWANGYGSPLMFVMRCNPQHYYLLHEIGHRLGMPHATIYKLLSENSTSNSQPAQVPSNPMGDGVMEDTYSDRLDIMACCKGDFSIYNRILSGWVPAAERAVISLQDVAAPPPGGRQFNFTLWPYDRPESVGQVKGVTIRLEDGKVLALGYRSLAFWQDVRVGRSKVDSDTRPLEAQHSRASVAGLSVEYSKRWFDSNGAPQWSIRGLLDFNRVFGRYPDALPATAGAYPRDPPGAAFTLLREGDAWLDEEHNLLLAVDKVVDCSAPAKVPVHRYSVYNFYGFRGENPGEESPEQADYTGYSGPMKCLQLRVRTGVRQAPGALDVRIKVEGVDANQRLVLDGPSCGYSLQPRLTLMPPNGVNLASVTWMDNSNTTFATGVLTAQLPPLSSLLERSATGSDRCNLNCDWSYHIKAMADNGAQTLIDVTVAAVLVDKVMLRVRYTYYLRDRVLQALETHTIPVWLAGSGFAGRVLSATPVDLGASAQLARLDQLPATTCSRQWTLTTLLQVPSGAWDYTIALDIPVLAMQAPDAATSTAAAVTAGQPGLLLRIRPAAAAGSGDSTKGGVLLVVTMGGRERWMDITAGLPDGSGSKSSVGLHIALVRDGNRLGVWGNGVGGWVLQDVGCLPATPMVTYCAGQPTGAGWAVGAVQLGQAGGSSRGVRATYLRMYNYALPKGEFDDESLCATAAANCGRYLLQGWARIPPSITRGSVQREGASIQTWTASTPITLRNLGYYMLVGPWSACSARCGGGFASRTVRCMKMSTTFGGPPVEVDLDECPITGGDDAPASSRRCNTVACPVYELHVMAPADGACNSTSSNCLANQQRPSLVCASSYGFVQPLRFCQDPSLATNPTWNSLRLPAVVKPTAPPTALNLTAMWSTSPLRLSLPGPAATLADAITRGLINSTCGSGTGCAAASRWQLGKWGACSKRCDGGTRTRTADCIQTSSGSLLPADQCSRTHGGVLQMLSSGCNAQPCNPAIWKVTPWTACAGDAAYGASSRQVTCETPTGGSVAAAACTAQQPNSTAVCVRTAATANCRPKFVPPRNYGGLDCYGRGSCSMRGCSCDEGWAGQFCEMSTSKCSGVVDKGGRCCASGMVDATGVCCTEGAVLDGAGTCCKAGWVDACGTCGGKAWLVDAQGVCCETRMDAAGFCCPSGYVDECGVCDGDSRSCAVDIYLTASPRPSPAAVTNATQQLQKVQLQKVWTTLLAALSAAGAGPWRVLNVTEVVLGGSAAGSSNGSQALPDDATILSKNTAARRLQADLAESGGAGGTSAASSQTCSADGDADDGYCTAADSQGVCRNAGVEDTDATGRPGQCSAEEMLAAGHQQPSAGSEPFNRGEPANDAGTSEQRRRLAQAVPDNSTTVLVRVVPAETEGDPPATLPLALTTLSGPVAAALQQQPGVQQVAGQPPQPYGVLSVQMMERMGVCGNGVCEVGERPWVDAQGSTVQPATAACPQDCPLPLVVCPAPLTVGDSSKECGGNGRCLRTQGTCDCFMGYTGDSCGECAAGYYAIKGRCLAQYIDGFNIFHDPELSKEPLLQGWLLWLVVGGGAAVLLLVLLVAGFCWLRAKRRGVLPGWLGGGRHALSRKRKYQMDFDKAVAGGSASTSPSSGRIGAMPSPRNMLLQRLRHTTDSPLSSMAEEAGGPRDGRQANPLYGVNDDGTYILDHDDAELVLAATAPPASPTVRAMQRAATRTGQQLSRAATGAGQSLSRAATAAQQGIARVLSGVPGVGPQLSAAVSRGGSYQYAPVGSLEGEYEDGRPRHSAGYGSEDPGSARSAEMVNMHSPREGAHLGATVGEPHGHGGAGRAAGSQYGMAGRSMEEVYSQLMRNKESEVAGATAAGGSSSAAAAGGQAGGRYRVPRQQQQQQQPQPPPQQQQQQQPVPAQGRQAAAMGQRQAAETAAEQDNKRARRGVPASRLGPVPVPGTSSPSPDHHQQQQPPAGGPGMPQLRIRTATDKPPEVAGMAPFQLPTAAAPGNLQPPKEVMLDPRVADAARAARVSEGGMGGQMLRARQRAISQQGGAGQFVSTPDYGDRDGIVAFGRRMEQWFSPDRDSSAGGSNSGGGSSSGGGMPPLPVSRGAAGLEEGEPGNRQGRGPEAGRGKGRRQD